MVALFHPDWKLGVSWLVNEAVPKCKLPEPVTTGQGPVQYLYHELPFTSSKMVEPFSKMVILGNYRLYGNYHGTYGREDTVSFGVIARCNLA